MCCAVQHCKRENAPEVHVLAMCANAFQQPRCFGCTGSAEHTLSHVGRVWLQSDVHLAARHMRNMFFETVPSCFAPDPSLHYQSAPLPSPTEPSRETRAVDAGRSFESSDSADHQALGVDSSKFLGWEQAGWLDCSPLSVPTEREVHTQERGGSVWRFMLVRL